ncbi:hypothetical protein DsansV1_C44g0240301 [Dioscorea sansibarensis]
MRAIFSGFMSMQGFKPATLGGTKAASLFLFFSAVFSDCFSCLSCHFFADFFLSLRKYSPLSNSRSICNIPKLTRAFNEAHIR